MSPHVTGIYPTDSITEVAHSLPIDPLGPGAADLLAGDVEYRIHLIAQEAKKFMVNGRRSVLLPQDVEYAMEALNVEPVLIPPTPLPLHPFAATPNLTTNPSSSTHHHPGHSHHHNHQQQQQLYHIADDEIDFSTYLKQPLPPGLGSSSGVKWKAHWLAVEGVQPAIPENPILGGSSDSSSVNQHSRSGPSHTIPTPLIGSAASSKILAKSQLPQELQLYFTRLTSALIPATFTQPASISTSTVTATEGTSLPDVERHRLAALASLRNDAAISGLLVYIVRWWAESVNKCLGGYLGVLSCLIDAGESLVENHTLFLEPYLHQLLSPLLSILLTVPLGPHPPSSSSSSSSQNQPSPFDIRSRAAEMLGKIARVYGKSYAGLIPRLTSTLRTTFLSPPFPSPLGPTTPPIGRYEGSLLGLSALGPGAVRAGLWGDKGDGLGRVDSLYTGFYGGKSKGGLMKACVKALQQLIAPKPSSPDQVPPYDPKAISETFGPNFVKALEKRPWMASELLRFRREDEQRLAALDASNVMAATSAASAAGGSSLVQSAATGASGTASRGGRETRGSVSRGMDVDS